MVVRSQATNYPDKLSYNVIADLNGTEIPDEIVFMSGHMDSWDFGSGVRPACPRVESSNGTWHGNP